jgi:hypothetical protein
MKAFFILFAIILGCPCENNCVCPGEKENLSNAIIQEVVNQLKNEYELIPCGTGGQSTDQIKTITLAFISNKSLNIEKGREVLITAVESLVNEINANEAIRPYLSNYPFDSKNIEIRIFIHDRNVTDFGPEKLYAISELQGVLQYQSRDPATKRPAIIYEETFEDALEKLNFDKQNG